MKINISQNSLVVMVGAMGTGKSTLMDKHFQPHNIVSSDFIREQLTGDFKDQHYNKVVFDILYHTIEQRLKNDLFTVIDSTGSRSVIQKAYEFCQTYNKQLVVIQLPHLNEAELIEERLKHRWKHLHTYYSQVKRIDHTTYPKKTQVELVDDINDVQIVITNPNDKYKLDSAYKYVVVPDLHGEYTVLEKLINLYKDDLMTHFIFLGDIVDRGESSYKTFQLVNRCIKSGTGFGVISNHDNKLYRWFKKFRDDEDDKKWFYNNFANYGMRIAHGMTKTLTEFQLMDSNDMKCYMNDFIEYYENLNPYLKLIRDDGVHFFSHAGISYNTVKGLNVTKTDIGHLLYKTLTDDVLYKENVYVFDEKTHLHLGHHVVDNKPTINYNDADLVMYKHDFGLGKTDFIVNDNFKDYFMVV